jgi:ubiquinone/menaquinone biosynthesis C-methylase UbiE
MIAKIFLRLTDYPVIRRIMWKPIYEWLAKKFNFHDWHFMNYGYAPFAHERKLKLSAEDEVHGYAIQLYHYLASKVTLEGMDVLEIGSGRGGGCNYIKRYFNPRKITGIDVAGHAVNFSKQTHNQKGLYYKQGNAEALPFENWYFDIVINVESCHAYGSVPKFLSEVKRVLCDGGYFLCADLRSPDGMITLRRNLLNSGLTMIEEETITENVVLAIEEEELIKKTRIEKFIPRRFQKIFKEFAGVRGSKIHQDLKTGTLVYHRFVLQKIVD